MAELSVPAATTFKARPTLRLRLRRLAPVLTLALFIGCWQLITALNIYPAFIIPPPSAVWDKFVVVVGNGTLWTHTETTLSAVLTGGAIGLLAGVVMGYALSKSVWLETLLSPLVIGLQSTPIVAYAPLLVIWFGSGINSKIVTSALIVFFPMMMNTLVGIRSIPAEWSAVMLTLYPSRWQLFTKLEVPAALPVLLGGLKISVTLAVIGAIVGEFISANAGLGFLMNLARSQYDTPLVMVCVLTLASIARLLYWTASWLERRVLFWLPINRHD